MDPLVSLPSQTDIRPKLMKLSEGDARKAIDLLISQGAEYICSLKTLRNEYTGISSLPDELLAMALVKAVEPKSDFAPALWREHVQLTAVCRLWRKVTLHTPAFWSCIPFDDCNHLEEMVERSKMHPLAVRLDFNRRFIWARRPSPGISLNLEPGPAIDRQLITILDGTRLRELHLHIGQFSQRSQECVNALPQIEAPLLLSLRISCQKNHTPLVIPTLVLWAPKPRLRHLQLDGIQVNWTELPDINIGMANLITLELKNLKPAPPGMFIRHVISSSPNLECLTIESALPADLEPPVGLPSSRIFLRSLQSCKVKETEWRPLVHLLLGIRFPQHTRSLLEINPKSRVSLTEENSHALDRLLEVCEISSNSEVARGYQKLTITHSWDNVTIACMDNEADEHLDSALKLVLPPSAFSTLHRTLRVQELENLGLSLYNNGLLTSEYHPLPPNAQWQTFFKRHPDIKQFSLSTTTITEFITALSAAPIQSSDTRQTPFLLPQLKSLQFYGPCLTDGEIDLFADMIMARSQQRLDLEELIISDGRGFENDTMNTLKEALGQRTNITWDDEEELNYSFQHEYAYVTDRGAPWSHGDYSSDESY